jgi:hypothetical protein
MEKRAMLDAFRASVEVRRRGQVPTAGLFWSDAPHYVDTDLCVSSDYVFDSDDTDETDDEEFDDEVSFGRAGAGAAAASSSTENLPITRQRQKMIQTAIKGNPEKRTQPTFIASRMNAEIQIKVDELVLELMRYQHIDDNKVIAREIHQTARSTVKMTIASLAAMAEVIESTNVHERITLPPNEMSYLTMLTKGVEIMMRTMAVETIRWRITLLQTTGYDIDVFEREKATELLEPDELKRYNEIQTLRNKAVQVFFQPFLSSRGGNTSRYFGRDISVSTGLVVTLKQWGNALSRATRTEELRNIKRQSIARIRENLTRTLAEASQMLFTESMLEMNAEFITTVWKPCMARTATRIHKGVLTTHLNEQDKVLIESIKSKPNNINEVMLWYSVYRGGASPTSGPRPDEGLTRVQLQKILVPFTWLDDGGITAMLETIERKANHMHAFKINPGCKRVAYMNSQMHGILTRSQREVPESEWLRPDGVYTKHGGGRTFPDHQLDYMLDADILLIVRHVTGNHWALTVWNVTATDQHGYNLVHYDSLHPDGTYTALELKAIEAPFRFLQARANHRLSSSSTRPPLLPLVSDPRNTCPQQINFSDCGVYALTCAELAAGGVTINRDTFGSDDIEQLRERIVVHINDEHYQVTTKHKGHVIVETRRIRTHFGSLASGTTSDTAIDVDAGVDYTSDSEPLQGTLDMIVSTAGGAGSATPKVVLATVGAKAVIRRMRLSPDSPERDVIVLSPSGSPDISNAQIPTDEGEYYRYTQPKAVAPMRMAVQRPRSADPTPMRTPSKNAHLVNPRMVHHFDLGTMDGPVQFVVDQGGNDNVVETWDSSLQGEILNNMALMSDTPSSSRGGAERRGGDGPLAPPWTPMRTDSPLPVYASPKLPK